MGGMTDREYFAALKEGAANGDVGVYVHIASANLHIIWYNI